MKKLLLSLAALFTLSFTANAQTVVSFADGLPEGWTKTGTVQSATRTNANVKCQQMQANATITSPALNALTEFTISINISSPLKALTVDKSTDGGKNWTTIKTINASDCAKSEFRDFTVSTGEISGDVQIKLTAGASSYYISSFTYTQGSGTGKQPAGIGFANENVTMTIGEAAPLFKNPNTLEVAFTSTNEKVAYMDETGAVRVLMPGKTTITATTEANDEFEGGEAVLNLTVRSKAEANAPATDSNTFTKVTSDAQLADGSQFIIVSDAKLFGSVQYGPMALSTAKSSGKGFDGEYLAENDATTSADSYTVTNDKIKIFTLETAGENAWYAKCADGYLDASTVKSLKLSETTENIPTFTFTPNTSETTVTFSDSKGNLRANFVNGSGGVRGSVTINTYASGQNPVFLYVREKGALAVPTIVPTFDEGDEQGSLSYSADGEGNWIVFITKNGSIELKAADESHSVFYSMENQTSTETPSEPLKVVAPKDGFQAYEAPIQLGDEHKGNKYMIKFYAADENGVESPVESLVVDYTKPTGIEAIGAEAGEAVYFDLQGNRVAAPETGVYIKVVGGHASKVLF